MWLRFSLGPDAPQKNHLSLAGYQILHFVFIHQAVLALLNAKRGGEGKNITSQVWREESWFGRKTTSAAYLSEEEPLLPRGVEVL